MKEYFEKSLKRRGYEAPQVEVVAIDNQGILCSSTDGNTRGCIESMNLADVNWP